MKYPINIEKLDDSLEFFSETKQLLEEANIYLKEHSWCKEIKQGWLYTNIGRVICIFLFEIDNNQSVEDNFIWVMVGDFPSMYLDTINVKSTKEVIENYIYIVNDWINHVECGETLNDCYPLDASTDPILFELLKKKVGLLEKKILTGIDDIVLSGR
jgi:hypothetical protein